MTNSIAVQGSTPELRRPRPLEDKLRIPQFSFPVLPRRRLTNRLDQATRRPVTLVHGPAGAGKTVACASWAAARLATRRVVWLTLEAEDHPWLWAYICCGLARTRAVPAEALESLEDVSADVFPLRLAQAAQLFTEPVVLVLDDVQTVTSHDAVRRGLGVLARYCPPALRLVLSGRPPMIGLSSPRLTNDFAEIDETDLACTADEADAYLALRSRETTSAPH